MIEFHFLIVFRLYKSIVLLKLDARGRSNLDSKMHLMPCFYFIILNLVFFYLLKIYLFFNLLIIIKIYNYDLAFLQDAIRVVRSQIRMYCNDKDLIHNKKRYEI
jgi:hypothetical protein